MKTHLRTKAVVLLLLSALGLSSTHCGIILHPERSGKKGGNVDIVAVILDCCWLLVGIIPGVVALLVDVVTGGLYGGLRHLHPGDGVGLRFNGPAPATADLAVTLSSPDGTVRTLASRHVEKGEEVDSAPVNLPSDIEPGRYGIAISVNGRENARFHVQVQ